MESLSFVRKQAAVDRVERTPLKELVSVFVCIRVPRFEFGSQWLMASH